MMTRAYVPTILAAAVSLAGCGLPSADRQKAESAASQVEEQRKAVSDAQSDLDDLAQDSFFGPFVRRENPGDSFKQAGAALDEAKKRYQTKVVPILEADKSEDVAKLRAELKPIKAEIGKASQLIKKPAESRDRLAKAREEFQRRATADAAQLVSESGDLVDGMRVTLGRLQGSVDEAAKNHPSRAADISAFATSGATIYSEAQDGLDKAKSASAEGSGDAVGDHSMTVKHCAEHLNLLSENTAGQLKELGASYSKTLIDMRADFYVIVRRLSWSSRYDRPPLHNYDYAARKVPEDVYDYFDKLNVDPLAKYRRRANYLRLSGGVDADRWKAIRIDPNLDWTHQRDDEAEFWIQKFQEAYFHKYAVVRDGERQETDWIPVSEAFFYAHINDLGMDIEAKPYGSFESEKITEATPPGMAYVGNPRYGRWESDGRGGRRWGFFETYLFYHLIFGGRRHYYGYNTWNTWGSDYRGRRPFYGGTQTAPLYGSRGRVTQTAPRYQGSAFAGSGGFRRASASVRGAGPGGRGGSFGGSGK